MNLDAELTRRELEIVGLLAWGASKKEIPYRLKVKEGKEPISVHTVENIVRSVYEKIEVQKVNELCVWYFCKYHKVDIKLSLIKRGAGALMMLVLLVPSLLDNELEMLRAQRTGASRTISLRVSGVRGRTKEFSVC